MKGLGADENIILASKSPRRRELFSLITGRFECVSPDVDESVIALDKAEPLCLALAKLKAETVFETYPGRVVVGCDTVVDIDGAILGKPANRAQAFDMIKALSGRVHMVYTGVCIKTPHDERIFSCATSVEFYPLTDEEIEDYISGDEPYDKAGAYGIQGRAARFVKGIGGDYFNIMGLPVSMIYNTLKDMRCL